MTFKANDFREMACKAERIHMPTLASMLRQAADDAEFREFWESSGEDTARTPKEQTK